MIKVHICTKSSNIDKERGVTDAKNKSRPLALKGIGMRR